MPWKAVDPMDEKVCFLADVMRSGDSMAELCRRYGISRKTGYKWVGRYRSEGFSGLWGRSRRPRSHPQKTPYAVRKAIVEARGQGSLPPGPKKIAKLLERRFRLEEIPSKTTIHKILKEEGLVQRRRHRRRVAPSSRPFGPVEAANDLWTADFKGQFKLGSGQWCYPLTVMDHQSRYLLGCQGVTGTGLSSAKRAFREAFERYGLPRRIRTDNGVPFASTSVGGLSRLSIWWIRLGIKPERIDQGQPQQNGAHERMHRTLKAATTRPASRTMPAQQRRFDVFREEYNERRPHEALGQETPQSCYEPSGRPYPRRLGQLEYPSYYERRKVHPNGTINWRNTMIYVGSLLHTQQVGLCEIDDGIWYAFFGPVQLGQIDEREIGRGSTPYLRLKKCYP